MDRPRPVIIRLDADALADALGARPGPASLLLEAEREDGLWCLGGRGWSNVRVLAAGSPAEADRHPAARGARRIDRAGCTLIPGLVNAHAHLDLTHIGPLAHDPGRGFVAWVDQVRARRHADPAAIAASVARGVEMSLCGGVVAVGDIAGAVAGRASLLAARALAASPVRGTAFVEFFATGLREEMGLDALRAALDEAQRPAWEGGRVRLGIQPHAPYSVSRAGYDAALRKARARGLPLCTHLAESPEEARYIAEGSGPLVDLLVAAGALRAPPASAPGAGQTPVAYLGGWLKESGSAAVHLNQLSDADVATLAAAKASGGSAIYCPRASAYFGAERHFGPHRYRDLLKAGLRVALGTDSVLNLGSRAARITPWDDMVLLRRRDGVDPLVLLRMATTDAACAIGHAPGAWVLKPARQGPLAGVVALPAGSLGEALDRAADPELIVLG